MPQIAWFLKVTLLECLWLLLFLGEFVAATGLRIRDLPGDIYSRPMDSHI